MARIRINTDGLKSNISEMNNYIATLEQLNNRLQTLITRINDSWEGNACKAYVEAMMKRLSKSKEMVKVLVAFRGYMQQAVSKFEERDKIGAGNILAVSGGVRR